MFENRGFPIGYDIINWVTFPNQTFIKNKVGEISLSHTFSIMEEAIVWHRTLEEVRLNDLLMYLEWEWSCSLGLVSLLL